MTEHGDAGKPHDPSYMRERAADLTAHGAVDTDYGPGVRATEALAAESLKWAADRIESLEAEIQTVRETTGHRIGYLARQNIAADSVVEAARDYIGLDGDGTRGQRMIFGLALGAYDKETGT